jgi:hypothetical protein
MFNYIHQQLITTWVLLVFAVASALYHRRIRDALRQRAYWRRPIYPAWVGTLIIAFLAFQYSYSGVTKLRKGGLAAGSGLRLQLLVFQQNDALGKLRRLNAATRYLLDHRWFANLAMTSAVILETGAIIGLTSSRLRPWWALGLTLMHFMVIVTMQIFFVPNMVVLLWLAVPGKQWSIAAQPVAVELAVANRG